jgi:hypothetical protein
MNKIIIALLVCCLFSCSSKLTYENYDEKHDDPTDKVTIKLVSLKEGVGTFALKNNSKYMLRYEHWFGQSKSPVAYCAYKAKEISVCSKNVFLLENEFYTHDTVLAPGEKFTFVANVQGANSVGLKFWSKESGKSELYFWFNLD